MTYSTSAMSCTRVYRSTTIRIQTFCTLGQYFLTLPYLFCYCHFISKELYKWHFVTGIHECRLIYTCTCISYTQPIYLSIMSYSFYHDHLEGSPSPYEFILNIIFSRTISRSSVKKEDLNNSQRHFCTYLKTISMMCT